MSLAIDSAFSQNMLKIYLNLLSSILYLEFTHLHSFHIINMEMISIQKSEKIISNKKDHESVNLDLCDIKNIISSMFQTSFKCCYLI